VGKRAALVAVLGVILPFALGYAFVGPGLGHPATEASFVAAAMVATSVGITARVLRDLGVIRSAESRIILGAAVIDDILAMIILAVVVGMASTGGISTAGIALIAAQAFGFTLFVVLVGAGLVRRYALRLDRLRMDGAPLAVALLAMLGLATASASVGLAAIIGAFLAGMVFAEAREHFVLERQALPIYQFLVPFFFVLTGSNVDWRLFTDPGTLGIALAVTVLALVGKLVGGGAGMLGTGRRSMAIVGVGMAPRGEVGLIVAGIGFSLGAIPSEVFGVVVVMSVLTTVVVPPALKLLFRGRAADLAPVGSGAGQAGHLPDL
jgi:Kef-type K+ transport system membrane component KefB